MADRFQDFPVVTMANVEQASVKFRAWNPAQEREVLVVLSDLVGTTQKGSAYDVAQFTSGAPTSSAVVFAMEAVRALKLPATAPLSVMKAKTAATASTTFNIQKNGSTVGTVVFAISGTVGTITVASDVVLAAGDLLEIVAPGSADATLASLRTTLVFTVS